MEGHESRSSRNFKLFQRPRPSRLIPTIRLLWYVPFGSRRSTFEWLPTFAKNNFLTLPDGNFVNDGVSQARKSWTTHNSDFRPQFSLLYVQFWSKIRKKFLNRKFYYVNWNFHDWTIPWFSKTQMLLYRYPSFSDFWIKILSISP